MSREIAAERIERLADLAFDATREGDAERSREYVRLARRIAERHRLSLPIRLKRYSCGRCDVAQVPGVNARVRLADGHVVVRCDCGATARYPYD